jgi:hypothetical protein
MELITAQETSYLLEWMQRSFYDCLIKMQSLVKTKWRWSDAEIKFKLQAHVYSIFFRARKEEGQASLTANQKPKD